MKARCIPNPILNDASPCLPEGVGLPGEFLVCGGRLDQMAPKIPSGFQVSMTLVRPSPPIAHLRPMNERASAWLASMTFL